MSNHNGQAEKLRVGVIGAGFMGKLHATHYLANDRVELVGVADICPETAKKVADELNCAWFTDSEKLADNVDAVSVAVPSTAHYEVVKTCIERNVHTLIEKPLASTISEAQGIVDLTQRYGTICMVGHQERFNPAIVKALEIVEEPKFIDAHRQGRYMGRGGDVDVINDLMIHDIDLVLAFIKAPVIDVSGIGAPVVTDHVDVVNARIAFKNQIAANVTASRVETERRRIFRIYTRKGFVKLDLLNQTVTVNAKLSDWDSGSELVEVETKVEVAPNITLKAEIDHFVDTIFSGGVPLVTVEDGMAAMQVAEMIRGLVNHTQ